MVEKKKIALGVWLLTDFEVVSNRYGSYFVCNWVVIVGERGKGAGGRYRVCNYVNDDCLYKVNNYVNDFF